jgi:hypothetical protein
MYQTSFLVHLKFNISAQEASALFEIRRSDEFIQVQCDPNCVAVTNSQEIFHTILQIQRTIQNCLRYEDVIRTI